MNNYVINLEGVSKRFPFRPDRPGLKEFLVNLHKTVRNRKDKYFWALNGINLRIREGECLGIIGRNGAGKSTLLSLMLGTTYPTEGRIEVRGKRTPLLELGAGFHPDLTGRENVLINGILLGFTKEEVLKRMDKILEFSELGDFANMPARTYSSGMYMRLAFSVAIHTDPEILLIDEIIAVGDEYFQKRSKEALLGLIKSGVTTIIVSHNLKDIVDICDRVIWLEQGKIKADGDPAIVVEEYRNEVSLMTLAFDDIPSGHWAESYIKILYSKRVTSGYSIDPLLYGPDMIVTRSQLPVFIIQSMVASGKLLSNFTYPETPYFTDVPSTNWAFKYIQKIVELNIITVDSGRDLFCPDIEVTRSAMAEFMIRAKIGDTFIYSTTPYFTDVPSDHQAFKYIQKMKELNITAGSGEGTYSPESPVTRAEMAVFLVKVFLQ
jgi:ABC-type polysaccharide/polyol phosphate transport system ATPase subunit